MRGRANRLDRFKPCDPRIKAGDGVRTEYSGLKRGPRQCSEQPVRQSVWPIRFIGFAFSGQQLTEGAQNEFVSFRAGNWPEMAQSCQFSQSGSQTTLQRALSRAMARAGPGRGGPAAHTTQTTVVFCVF